MAPVFFPPANLKTASNTSQTNALVQKDNAEHPLAPVNPQRGSLPSAIILIFGGVHSRLCDGKVWKLRFRQRRGHMLKDDALGGIGKSLAAPRLDDVSDASEDSDMTVPLRRTAPIPMSPARRPATAPPTRTTASVLGGDTEPFTAPAHAVFDQLLKEAGETVAFAVQRRLKAFERRTLYATKRFEDEAAARRVAETAAAQATAREAAAHQQLSQSRDLFEAKLGIMRTNFETAVEASRAAATASHTETRRIMMAAGTYEAAMEARLAESEATIARLMAQLSASQRDQTKPQDRR